MGVQAMPSLRAILTVMLTIVWSMSFSLGLVGCSKANGVSGTVSALESDGGDGDVDEDDTSENVASKLALTTSEKEALYGELKNDPYLTATVVQPETIDDVLDYFPFSRIVTAKVTTQTTGKVDVEFQDSSGAKVRTPKTFLGGSSKGFVADGILILNLKTKISRVYTTVFIDINNGYKVSGLAGSGLVTLSTDTIPTGLPITCKATNEEYKVVNCQISRESGRVVAREIK